MTTAKGFDDCPCCRLLAARVNSLKLALKDAIEFIDWSSEHLGADELIKELRAELEK